MLTTYFKRQTTCATYYAGPAGSYLDEFTDWLAQRGYRQETIRNRLQGASQLCTWVRTNGIRLQSLSPRALDDFRHYLSDRNRLHLSGGQLSIAWLGAQIFFEFLQAKRLVASSEIQPTDALFVQRRGYPGADAPGGEACPGRFPATADVQHLDRFAGGNRITNIRSAQLTFPGCDLGRVGDPQYEVPQEPLGTAASHHPCCLGYLPGQARPTGGGR